MKAKLFAITLISILAVSAVSAQISPELEDRLEQKPDTEKIEVIILTQPNANEQATDAVRSANGNVTHDFSIIDGVAVEIPAVAAENLADRDFVREIQPDYTVETILDQSVDTVNAEEVWNQNNTGEEVNIAVLDTGIEDNTILNVEDQVDYTGEGTDDLNGHGTHVAGITASPNDNYRGMAYSADLFDVKVLDQEGSGSASDVISGLEWAVDNNADVATLSLGAEVDQCDGTSSISEAVDNTVENGVTVTVAAGNNGPESGTITAPGCAEKPITVGSSSNGQISDFSSRGPTADGRVKPDLVAPGESITSLTNNDGDSPQFETLSGTSMATPHVTGAAALLLAEKDMTPSEVKNLTTYTAEDLGFGENSQGAGRLDAYAAYQQVAETENQEGNQPPTVEVLEVQVNTLNESAEAELSINATDEDNETLNATFYLEGEEVNLREGYGEIKQKATNLSLNTTYSWNAEVTDGINTTSTGTQSFNTDIDTDKENETGGNQTGNRTKPALPEEASDTARKARAGFFNPNSPLYSLDLAFDRVSVAVGLKTRESVMEERASEARVMAERGNQEAAERAISELRKTAGDSENATREAEETLNRVIKDSPEEAKQGLRNALENVEKGRNASGDQQSPESTRQRSDQAPERQPQENKSRETSLNRKNPENSSNRNISDKNPQKKNPHPEDQTDQENNLSQGDQRQPQNKKPGAENSTEAEKGNKTSAKPNADSDTNTETEKPKKGSKNPLDKNSENTEETDKSDKSGGINLGSDHRAEGLVGNFFKALLG